MTLKFNRNSESKKFDLPVNNHSHLLDSLYFSRGYVGNDYLNNKKKKRLAIYSLSTITENLLISPPCTIVD